MKKVKTFECPIEGELNYMQEEIEWLAEDIVDYGDALQLHAERLYYLEENCFWVDGDWGIRAKLEEVDETQDELIENVTQLVHIIDLAADVAKNQNAILEIQNEEIGDLKNEIDKVNNVRFRWTMILSIWNLLLTIWIGLSFWL